MTLTVISFQIPQSFVSGILVNTISIFKQAARLHATPGLEVVGSIPAPGASSMLVGSVSVCDWLRQKSWSPRSVSVWKHIKLFDLSFGACPLNSLVADKDDKKPTNEPTKQ